MRRICKTEDPVTRREPLLRGWWWVDGRVARLMADAAAEGIMDADIVITPSRHGHSIVEAWTMTLRAMQGVTDVLRQCTEQAAGYPIAPDEFLDHLSRLTPPLRHADR